MLMTNALDWSHYYKRKMAIPRFCGIQSNALNGKEKRKMLLIMSEPAGLAVHFQTASLS